MRPPEPLTPIRVFLIEAHCSGLAALGELLQRTVEKDIVYVGRLVGHSSNWLESIHQAQADVVLVDLLLQPETTAFVDRGLCEPVGLTTIRALHGEGQAAFKILAYSHGEHLRRQALEAGADAFLTKDVLGAELRHMIRAVVTQDTAAAPPRLPAQGEQRPSGSDLRERSLPKAASSRRGPQGPRPLPEA